MLSRAGGFSGYIYIMPRWACQIGVGISTKGANMLNLVFAAGLLVFAASSVYFHIAGRSKDGLNSAFLVSFVTLISYVLMWQGDLTVVTRGGQPIFWTRWLFYALSCTLLMVEIAQLKSIQGDGLVRLVYLTAIVMFTGFLAARDLTAVRWVHFVISSVAYVLLVTKVLSVKTPESQWVGNYIVFGWTAFPIVFALAPTGLGLFGAAVANLLYLVLDIYTKIVFNIQLGRTLSETPPA
jgi:bacteriorhodopsin